MSICSYNTSLWKVLWVLIFLVTMPSEAKNMLFALQVTHDRSLIITHNAVCHHMTLLLLLMSREMIKDVLKPSKRWAWLIRCCPTSLFICINSYTEFSSSKWQEGNLENDEQFSVLVLLLMKCQKGLTSLFNCFQEWMQTYLVVKCVYVRCRGSKAWFPSMMMMTIEGRRKRRWMQMIKRWQE